MLLLYKVRGWPVCDLDLGIINVAAFKLRNLIGCEKCDPRLTSSLEPDLTNHDKTIWSASQPKRENQIQNYHSDRHRALILEPGEFTINNMKLCHEKTKLSPLKAWRIVIPFIISVFQKSPSPSSWRPLILLKLIINVFSKVWHQIVMSHEIVISHEMSQKCSFRPDTVTIQNQD